MGRDFFCKNTDKLILTKFLINFFASAAKMIQGHQLQRVILSWPIRQTLKSSGPGGSFHTLRRYLNTIELAISICILLSTFIIQLSIHSSQLGIHWETTFVFMHFTSECKTFMLFSFSQSSFLASLLKQDPAAGVPIPVSTNTHFRAISGTRSASDPPGTPQTGQTTALETDKDAETSKGKSEETFNYINIFLTSWCKIIVPTKWGSWYFEGIIFLKLYFPFHN